MKAEQILVLIWAGFCTLEAHSFAPLGVVGGAKVNSKTTIYATKENEKFDLIVKLPQANLQANMQFESVLSVPSEIVEVRYKVPFGLNVEPKKGLAVCTKEGEGGEKVNDVLRYTSQWSLGLPAGDGLATTAASFAGGLSWKCTMFNVMKAKEWGQVVEALLSNEQVSFICYRCRQEEFFLAAHSMLTHFLRFCPFKTIEPHR